MAAFSAVLVYLTLKMRKDKQDPMKTTPIHSLPVYDSIIEISGKKSIELSGNVAYEHVKI